MIEVLKNLAKLLAVAVLAGVLGVLGGMLINSLTDDRSPETPVTTLKPELVRPQATLPPETRPTTAPSPPPETIPSTVPEDKPEITAPAGKPALAEEDIKPAPTTQDQATTSTTTTAKATTTTRPAPKPTVTTKAKAVPKATTTTKPKAPPTTKAPKPQEKPKQGSFEELVESEKDKVLLVKSVSASTVDKTVVIRVALDRSAEPKFSRLIGSGKLRIILDFENAVRIKGRVPDVIKSPSDAVQGIRIGAHPDKIRIVVDLNPSLTYSLNQHLFSRAYVLEIKPH